MVQKQANIYERSAPEPKCRHFWIIEGVTGSTSRGVCKFCGVQKEFKNYLVDCLEVNDEQYEEWLRRLGHAKGEKASEEDVLSWVGEVDRDAVKAGT